MLTRKRSSLLGLSIAALGLVLAASWPARGQQTRSGEEPPLPSDVLFEVQAMEAQVFKIGIPDMLGSSPHNRGGAAIMRNDFTLMPGYRAIGPESIRFDVAGEGMGVQVANWRGLDVSGVIKGQVSESGGRLEVQLKFYRISSPNSPAYEQTYRGAPSALRGWMHTFGNEVLRVLTGELGPFGTKIAYARREAAGRKDVMCSHMDGFNIMRVSNGRGIAMLPAFAPDGHIFFTRLTPAGMFITRSALRGRRLVDGDGLNMAPSICEDRMFFVSSRDGNSEIYSSDLQGNGIRRLTNHPAIDVSPSCGPNGKVAFVSARHGSPQIWIMNRDGSRQERLTFQGNHNQTPAFCRDPRNPWVAFTGRDGALDVFTVNVNTKEIKRLTQGQGNNKDPAFSPDCRIVAFSSDRRGAPGIYLSSPLGYGQNRVVEGEAETIRWATHR